MWSRTRCLTIPSHQTLHDPGHPALYGILTPSCLHTHSLQHRADQEGWTQQELSVYIPRLPVRQKPGKGNEGANLTPTGPRTRPQGNPQVQTRVRNPATTYTFFIFH